MKKIVTIALAAAVLLSAAPAYAISGSLHSEDSVAVRGSYAKRVTLRGIISDLSAELRSFTLTTKKGAEVNVTVNADAEVKVKNGTSTVATSFANLANGMAVKVRGLLQTSNSGTSTVRSVAATDIKAQATATHSTSSGQASSARLEWKGLDWNERWENWKERWEERRDNDPNDNDRDNKAHLDVLERIEERVDARGEGHVKIGL